MSGDQHAGLLKKSRVGTLPAHLWKWQTAADITERERMHWRRSLSEPGPHIRFLDTITLTLAVRTARFLVSLTSSSTINLRSPPAQQPVPSVPV